MKLRSLNTSSFYASWPPCWLRHWIHFTRRFMEAFLVIFTQFYMIVDSDSRLRQSLLSGCSARGVQDVWIFPEMTSARDSFRQSSLLASNASVGGSILAHSSNERVGRVPFCLVATLVSLATAARSLCHETTQGACWLCSGLQHDSYLQQHGCVRWCHHLCLMRSCRRVGRL